MVAAVTGPSNALAHRGRSTVRTRRRSTSAVVRHTTNGGRSRELPSTGRQQVLLVGPFWASGLTHGRWKAGENRKLAQAGLFRSTPRWTRPGLLVRQGQGQQRPLRGGRAGLVNSALASSSNRQKVSPEPALGTVIVQPRVRKRLRDDSLFLFFFFFAGAHPPRGKYSHGRDFRVTRAYGPPWSRWCGPVALPVSACNRPPIRTASSGETSGRIPRRNLTPTPDALPATNLPIQGHPGFGGWFFGPRSV